VAGNQECPRAELRFKGDGICIKMEDLGNWEWEDVHLETSTPASQVTLDPNVGDQKEMF